MILDSGYIIEKRPVNDIDAFIKIASRKGVFSYFIPRGNHFSSRLLGLFQPFYRVKFLYDVKGSGGLRVIYDYKSYEKLPDTVIFDEKKREFLFYLIKIYNRLTNITTGKIIMDLFDKSIKMLYNDNINVKGLSFSFLVTFLFYEGFYPSILTCSNCNREIHSYDFSIESGGFICDKCKKTKKYTKTNEFFYRALLYGKRNPKKIMQKFNWNEKILEFYDIIRKYFNYHFFGAE